MFRSLLSSTLIGMGFALLSSHALKAAAEPPHFEKDVLPILYHHCFGCHSEKQAKPKGKLRLDTAQGILESKVIVAGKPDDSELMKRLLLPSTDEDVMPPIKGGAQPSSEAERETIRRWIADGAKMGAWVKFDHRDQPLEVADKALTRADARRAAQELQEKIAQQQKAMGIVMNAPASDETFLRRVYLDVVGRIPSAAESRRFVDDKTPDKRTALIDALLDSEGYVSHTFNWKADQLRIVSHGLAGQPGWLYDDWVKNSIRSRAPHDEYVRGLLMAKGYLWQNGAVGFYMRDLGMPLDHMSNLTRVFLGTRIECAQCHDHPLEPITQKDFYQMAAYTFPVSNLCSSSGYSLDNVKQWPELKARMAELHSDEAFQQGLSRTISFLKRQTKETNHQLTFPETYKYDEAARKKPVPPRTLFGDDAPSTLGDRRAAFADWMVSPRNPRFARNIANRVWKRAMGIGLIEPVDSLSAINKPEHAELMDFLTQMMVRLRFDERAFLAMILNTRLYQSEAVREEPAPGTACGLRGPILRRLSAEQLWDSLLVFLVPDVDERKSAIRHDRSDLNPERLKQLTDMSADEIMERAKVEIDQRIKHRLYEQRLADQSAARKAAKAKGGVAAERKLQKEQAEENARYEAERNAAQMGGQYFAKETDPRWIKLTTQLVRASEIPTPIPLGHFLRQFGQSDRRDIDASNKDPNTTHSLALMNGDMTGLVLANESLLRTQLQSCVTDQERVKGIYQSILVRAPDADELQQSLQVFKASHTPETDLIWALLNTPEFLFNQ